MNTITTLAVLVAALALAVGLAFLPLRLLLGRIAAQITQFIVRQRERRGASRQTPERRKEISEQKIP